MERSSEVPNFTKTRGNRKNIAMFAWWDVPSFTDWVTAGAACVAATAAVIGTYAAIRVLEQNTRTIETSQKALLLNQASAISIEYPDTFAERPFFKIRNTSGLKLTHFEVYLTDYLITVQPPRKIIRRGATPSLVAIRKQPVELKSGDHLDLSEISIFNGSPYFDGQEPPDSERRCNHFYALVVAFHREVDFKRYVHVEPFTGEFPSLVSPLYGAPNTSSIGSNPVGLVESIRLITDTELTMYRSDLPVTRMMS